MKETRPAQTRCTLPSGSAASRYLFLLLMPLRWAPFCTLVVLSIVLTIALSVRPFGLPLALILLSWLFKYSFVLLDRLVLGDPEPPVLSVEMVMGSMGEWRSLLPLIIIVTLFFVSGAGSYWWGATAASIAAVVVVACLPAVLAVQGWTGSVGQSLNPYACFVMVRILATEYAWIAGCSFALLAVCLFAPQAVDAMPLALRIGLLIYAWLAVIAVTGGALYARRPELEQETLFIVTQQKVISPEEVARLRERWFDSIYGAWRSGAQDNAWHSAMERVEQSADALAELRWLYRRVAAWPEPQFANRVVLAMLPRLLAADRDGEALALVRERLGVDNAFRPQSSEERMRLARLASEWNDKLTAEALQRDLLS